MKFTKKKNLSRNVKSNPPNTAPIIRYYRPQNNDRISSSNQRKLANVADKDSHTNTIKRILKSLGRWFGVLLIIGLLLVNTGISSLGVKISGPELDYRQLSDYKSEIQRLMQSSVWYKNKLTLSSSKLEQQIEGKFPEISTATVVIPLAGRRLQVLLQFSKPLVRLLTADNKQAILSEEGVLVRQSSAENINAAFRDLPSLSIPNIVFKEGQQVLTGEEIQLVKLIISEFSGDNSLPEVNSIEFDIQKREMRVRFKNSQFYAKLTPEREAREQVGSIVAALNDFKEKRIQVNEYIDVRVEGRVFIR